MEQSGWGGGRGAVVPGSTFTGAAISICKCIFTIPIGAPIYIWPQAAMPTAPPLLPGTNWYDQYVWDRGYHNIYQLGSNV